MIDLIRSIGQRNGHDTNLNYVQIHCHPDEDEVEEVAHLQEEEGRLLPHRHHLPHHLPHRLPGVQHNLLVLLHFTFQQW